MKKESSLMANNTAKAYFGGGCFWCTEAIFSDLQGVEKVTPGYTGGEEINPNYFKVSEGKTGHAESIEIQFDPQQISYTQLLDVFWHTHNPTTLNQQGADVGTEYRSIILYINEEQKLSAEKMKKELVDSGEFPQPIVTEIKPFDRFYPAESYHENFYEKNRGTPYCEIVITPKLEKFHERYAQWVKKK
jgi:peptide-methionine (S)-S-oxide reductase